MLISAFAALVMFAAPETAQGAATTEPKPAKSADANEPKKTCYTPPAVSGSRLPPRKVCVTAATKGEDKAEKDIKSEAKTD